MTPTTLTLERAATVEVSNRDVMVWFRYEEYHGITAAGQARIRLRRCGYVFAAGRSQQGRDLREIEAHRTLSYLNGLFVIGNFGARVAVKVPCAGEIQINNSLIQGFVENLDVGLPGANGTSPDTKVTRSFLDRGVTNLWVHTADLFTFSDGGYYGYRNRGMVLCGDNNVDTLCHSTKIDSAEGASHFLSAAAGLDVGNVDGFEFRNVYDEPGLAHGFPEGAGPALRFGYVGSAHGGVVTGGTWSGNKVDTAVQFNAPGSSGQNPISVFSATTWSTGASGLTWAVQTTSRPGQTVSSQEP